MIELARSKWVKVAILSILLGIGLAVVGNTEDAEPQQRAAILDVLDTQTKAWNRGKLKGFMAGYWSSPDLIFTSGGQVSRGWEPTLEKYRETYGGGKASMGRLGFDEVEVYSLGSEAAWVLGRWQLEGEGDTSGGVFTLIFRQISGRWVIVHDHTSVEE
jgi:beta-aspartyl-peptidase (threonine type)